MAVGQRGNAQSGDACRGNQWESEAAYEESEWNKQKVAFEPRVQTEMPGGGTRSGKPLAVTRSHLKSRSFSETM